MRAFRKSLIAGSVLAGASLAGFGAAQAATVTPGGAFDLSISGFARFLVSGGDWQARSGLAKASNGVDFSNDTEVHVIGTAKDEASGLEYGFAVEFEADTNAVNNTDETWLYIKGGFGEIRVGDEDSPTDNMTLGAMSVAVGTGGIDGTGIDDGRVTFLTNSSDSTKVIYYSPELSGFQLGVSYTPGVVNNDGRQGVGAAVPTLHVDNVNNFLEAGVAYSGEFGDVGLKASVVGMWGQDESSDRDADTHGIYGGAVVSLFGFDLAGGVGTETVLDVDRTWFNAGAATKLGPVGLSVSYGKVVSGDVGKPYDLVLGAEVGLMPGVVLSGEVSFFKTDLGGDDDGVLGVGRLAFTF